MACRQIEKEQNDKALQSSAGPDFHREEIGGYHEFPVLCEKLLPGGFSASLRGRFETVPLEDVCDRAAGGFYVPDATRRLGSGGSPSPGSPALSEPPKPRSPRRCAGVPV